MKAFQYLMVVISASVVFSSPALAVREFDLNAFLRTPAMQPYLDGDLEVEVWFQEVRFGVIPTMGFGRRHLGAGVGGNSLEEAVYILASEVKVPLQVPFDGEPFVGFKIGSHTESQSGIMTKRSNHIEFHGSTFYAIFKPDIDETYGFNLVAKWTREFPGLELKHETELNVVSIEARNLNDLARFFHATNKIFASVEPRINLYPGTPVYRAKLIYRGPLSKFRGASSPGSSYRQALLSENPCSAAFKSAKKRK